MSDQAASRESKYAMLFHEISALTKEVQSFEDFLEKLRGTTPRPIAIGVKTSEAPGISFVEVYGGLPSNLRQLRERFTKARQELEELLV